MSFNKSVQKIFFMLAISISAILLCLVGVWAAQMNLAFNSKISPDIYCSISANGNEIFNNYNATIGKPVSKGNTLDATIPLSGDITQGVTFSLTNYTIDKHIRLSVVNIALSNSTNISSDAMTACEKATSENQIITPSETTTMNVYIPAVNATSATFSLKVEQVYAVNVNISNLAKGSGVHYFGPTDTHTITIQPKEGYQLPTTLTVPNTTTYTYDKHTSGTLGVHGITEDFSIGGKCDKIFGIIESNANTLGAPGGTYTINDKLTYFPNNGAYSYTDAEHTTVTLHNTQESKFVEYKYYVEIGMYPQSKYAGDPSTGDKWESFQALPASTKTITKSVEASTTTIDGQQKTIITTTTTTNITYPQSTSTIVTTQTLNGQQGSSGQTTTTIKTTYWQTATDTFAQIQTDADGNSQTTNDITTEYYIFEPIKWIVVGTVDGTALNSLHYKNGMLYTDGACGKPYTGKLVLMSAFIIDGSSFNYDALSRTFSNATINNKLNTLENIFTSSSGPQMSAIDGEPGYSYIPTQELLSQEYTTDGDQDSLGSDVATASFFLVGGNKATISEDFSAETYFSTTGIEETQNQKTYNVGVSSPTAFAIASGVEQNILSHIQDVGNAANTDAATHATAPRGWALSTTDNTPQSTSAYWTRSGGPNKGAYVINMNSYKVNVLATNTNIGMRPMMVLDLGFYENGTYTA